jgi:hypothetical protein
MIIQGHIVRIIVTVGTSQLQSIPMYNIPQSIQQDFYK